MAPRFSLIRAAQVLAETMIAATRQGIVEQRLNEECERAVQSLVTAFSAFERCHFDMGWQLHDSANTDAASTALHHLQDATSGLRAVVANAHLDDRLRDTAMRKLGEAIALVEVIAGDRKVDPRLTHNAQLMLIEARQTLRVQREQVRARWASTQPIAPFTVWGRQQGTQGGAARR